MRVAAIVAIGVFAALLGLSAWIAGLSAKPSGRPYPENGRLAIRHANDPSVAEISPTPRTASLSTLQSFPRPRDLRPDLTSPTYADRRIAPLETTQWTVRARVRDAVKRSDGDLYLVLTDAQGRRMVAEAPAPQRLGGSPYAAQGAQARKILEARLGTGPLGRRLDVPVEITGIGFYGWLSSRDPDRRDNGARLMPIVGVRFL